MSEQKPNDLTWRGVFYYTGTRASWASILCGLCAIIALLVGNSISHAVLFVIIGLFMSALSVGNLYIWGSKKNGD